MFVRRVVGNSMLPTLPAGTLVIVRNKQPVRGDLVVARLGNREVIKRAAKVGNGRVFLVGDNSDESTDSRQLGPVLKNDILGVVIMKFLAPKSLPAPEPTQRALLSVPYIFAALVTIMLLLQLFAFENFVPLMESMMGSERIGRMLAVTMVGVELFSLPFLLRMRLSLLARVASAWLSVILPLLWLMLVIIRPAGNIGLFGTTIVIENGMLNLFAAMLLSGLSVVSFYVLQGPNLLSGGKSSQVGKY